jgi:hypothetical protein
VNLPSFTQNRKLWLIIGGGAAGYVALRWWQSRGTTEPEATNDLTPESAGGAYGPGNVQYGGRDITTPSEVPTTNAEWTQKAVEALTGQGWEGTAVQVALGRFLARVSVTAAQADIIRAAIAAAGQPPVGGNYTIVPISPTTPVTPTPVAAPGAVTGFKTVSTTPTTGLVRWNPVSGATGYQVKTMWNSHTVSTSATQASFYGLKATRSKSRWNYQVRAMKGTTPGPWSATQYFLTPAHR